MRAPRITLSVLAIADILEQAEWYEVRESHELAKRWERAVDSALMQIVRRPKAGSPCRFRAHELRDVRRATIRGFPKHLIFYQFQEAEILILRVVHGARDLEGLFSG